MLYIYTMEYYSAIKNNEFMKFLGKWLDLEDIILSEVNTITKEYTWYALTDKWILAQKLRILLRREDKIPIEGFTETKFGAKTKGWTIQRLPHLGVHPIISHQTQTLLHMPAKFCWKDPDIAVSCEALPVRGKYRSGCSVSYWMDHRAPKWRS